MADEGSLYDRDFVRWSDEQAHALRSAGLSGTNLPLDWDHLAEEVDGLGRSLRSELRNRLATVLEHLLKLTLSAATDPRAGWVETILRERVEIDGLLHDNPSLRSSLPGSLDAAAAKSRKLAEISLRRHGEWSTEVSRACDETRFSEDQILGHWLPRHDGKDAP